MARPRDEALVMEALPDEDQVIAYLRRHPDFLSRHPQLMLLLTPPSRWTSADGVVDMQVYLIESLRQELQQTKDSADQILHTSRSNMAIQTRTHQAVVELLDTQSVAELARVVAENLPQLLDVDVVTLNFEPGQLADRHLIVPGIRRLKKGEVNRMLGGMGQTCVLYDDKPGETKLFGNFAASVWSSALFRLPCGDGGPVGVMALGSHHTKTFHAGQGTELLGFLAHVIGSHIRRFVA